jgi:hypothetical protein
MKKRDVSRRIAARRRLHAMAHEAAPFFGRERLARMLRDRAPDLVKLVGEREVEAMVELVSRPLGAA